MSLGPNVPTIYDAAKCAALLPDALAELRRYPQKEVATAVGITERRLRDALKGRSVPHMRTQRIMIRLAHEYRTTTVSSRELTR